MDETREQKQAETKQVKSAMDPALPYSPPTLVLARTTGAGEAGPVAELAELLEAGQKKEAHRLAHGHLDDDARRPALVDFYLREAAGRRGARLLLRWLRADDGRGDQRLFVALAVGAVQSWAHFRLLRHGRAFKLAQQGVGELTGAEANDRSAETRQRARAWGQTLEAIRTCALRRGSLRLALNFHELAVGLEEAHPGSHPAPKRARAAMQAVAYLLELHAEHGLPATVARYLARSLGHREGDSHAAWAEMVMDLRLEPEHLDGALEIARRFGFEGQVSERILSAKEKVFRGNWKARRVVQRSALILVYLLASGALLLAIVMISHLAAR